ncbi:MAG: helix-turn-helix transcriptional regulator [Magnetococcales bacterium]|nr:helix-turn-helix transcriptional regulator [Magnetococcales bacterium]
MNSKQEIPGFLDRLMDLIGAEAPHPWGERIGIARATMNGLLRGASPSTRTLLKIARQTETPLNWLLTGAGVKEKGPPRATQHLLAPAPASPDPAAGVVEGLAHLLGLDPDTVLLLAVQGDGMEPTLRTGDLLLVERNRVDVERDGVYLLEIHGALLPKRLQRTQDGGLLISNDNPAYGKERISRDGRERLKIAGRVVWVGRTL